VDLGKKVIKNLGCLVNIGLGQEALVISFNLVSGDFPSATLADIVILIGNSHAKSEGLLAWIKMASPL